MVDGNTPVWHVRFIKSGPKSRTVHTDPDCYYIRDTENLKGPKPLRTLPHAVVCKACSGEERKVGGGKRQATILLECSNPEDLGLTPVGE